MSTRRHHPEPKPQRSVFLSLWYLFFSVNDRFITYQQRRNWRARAAFFVLVGILLTLGVQATLGKHVPLCSR